MQISIFFVRVLMEELISRGVEPTAFCASVGVPPEWLSDPSVRIDFPHYNAIVERALRVTGDPQLGLQVGSRTHSVATTLLGHLVNSCITLREAAAMLFRYSSLLLEGGEWKLEERHGLAAISYTLPEQEAERAYGAELCFTLVCGILRPFVGDARAHELTFEHAPTGPIENYRRCFRGPVRFRAESNAIRGEAALLDRRFLLADPTLRGVLVPAADEILAELRSEGMLAARVRGFLLTRDRPCSVTNAEIASALGMSERTLHRQLKRSGIRLRDVVEFTLRDLACRSLRSRPIKDVAFKLGYAEVSAFHRAFRRWTGTTPADFQRDAKIHTESDLVH